MKPWSVMLWWLAVLVVGLLKTFPYLTVGCDKCILTSRNSLEDVVAKVLHEHMFLALHVLDDDVRDATIGVVLEGVLVLHDA